MIRKDYCVALRQTGRLLPGGRSSVRAARGKGREGNVRYSRIALLVSLLVSLLAVSSPAQAAFCLGVEAYGAKYKSPSKPLQLRPTPRMSMPCGGTGGVLRSASVSSLTKPPIVVTGDLTVTVQGTVGPSSATGELTSTVQQIDLFDGRITADVAKADAHAFTDGTTRTFSDEGSYFTNLQVSGHPEITDSVAPNTQVTLDGLGIARFHWIVQRPTDITVIMLNVLVTEQNDLGVPVGTEVKVATAVAKAT